MTKERNVPVLKGVGKIGEAVFVWNDPLPSPYRKGQYPQVGNESSTVSAGQYDFAPASIEEVRAAFDASLNDLQAQIEVLTDALAAARADNGRLTKLDRLVWLAGKPTTWQPNHFDMSRNEILAK